MTEVKSVDIRFAFVGWVFHFSVSVVLYGYCQSLVAVGGPVGSACACDCMAEWDRCGQGGKAEWGFRDKWILFTPRIGVHVD